MHAKLVTPACNCNAGEVHVARGARDLSSQQDPNATGLLARFLHDGMIQPLGHLSNQVGWLHISHDYWCIPALGIFKHVLSGIISSTDAKKPGWVQGHNLLTYVQSVQWS